MAQKQKSQKQTPDPYGQRGKTLASAAQRLRGWVGSDPSKTPDLADALVELTEHRLLGHAYPAAVTDCQEAVRLAAQLLTANGPIGPYTSVADATRCVAAMVQLATIQSALGRPDVGGQTMESVTSLQHQFRDFGLESQLSPRTDVWAASCGARAALASGDVAAANAHADSALARLVGSGLLEDPDSTYLAVDVERLVSDCRWAAGRAAESVGQLHVAKDRYDGLVAGRLTEPGRLSPALAERLAEPLFGLYRDLADRLLATGEIDHALATRRALVDLLQGLVGRLGEPARVQLSMALADLADDLMAADREDEAQAAAAEAVATAPHSAAAASLRLLVAAVHARSLTRAGRSAEALSALRPVVSDASGRSPAAQAVGLLAWAEALRADGQPDDAAKAEQSADNLTRDLLGGSVAGPDSRSAVLDLARGVVRRGQSEAQDGQVSAADVAEQERATAAWLEAERAEAHRLEQERMEQARVEAELREAERQRAERAAAEQLAADRQRAEDAERLAAERQAAAEEEERLARKRRREERIEAHRLEAAHNDLAEAQQAWREARTRGDRRAVRAATERVVELLRPRVEQDLLQYGPELQLALEELSSARLRSGDVWGSRAPAKEARALARALGR